MTGIIRSAPPRTAKTLEVAACFSVGVPEDQILAKYGERATDHGRRLGTFGFKELFRSAAEMEGVPVGSFGTYDSDTIRAAFTTASLPVLMSNVANVSLAAGYTAANAVADLITGSVDLTSLKTHTIYRLTADGDFAQVPADGNVTSGSFGEQTYAMQPATYGRLVVLTREMLINDDVGAFAGATRALGRAAALKKEAAVFSLFLASINANGYFTAANGNYFTGAGTVLSATSVASAAKALRETKDDNGQLLLLRPAIVLVPPALEESALTIQRNTTTDTGPAVRTNAGRYTPIVGAHMGAAGELTGGTDTGWAMLADPADVPSFYVGTLNGQTMPNIVGAELRGHQLGVYLRAVWDFGVAAGDHRAANYSTGA